MSADVEGHDDEGRSLVEMNREIDEFATDPALFAQIEKDYAEIIADFKDNPELELFKMEYETMFKGLQESLGQEQIFIKRCKEEATEITVEQARLDGVEKMIANHDESVNSLKTELEIKKQNIEEEKLEKQKYEHDVELMRRQIEEQSEKQEDVVEAEEVKKLQELHALREQKMEVEKENEAYDARIKYLRNENEFEMSEVQEQEQECLAGTRDVEKLNEEIMDFKEQTSKQEQRQTEMESKMKEIKQSVDEAKNDLDKKVRDIVEINRELEEMGLQHAEKSAAKDMLSTQLRAKKQELELREKEKANLLNELENMELAIEELKKEKEVRDSEIEEEELVVAKMMKESEILAKKKNKLVIEKEMEQRRRDEHEAQEKIWREAVEEQRKRRDALKEEVDIKLKERGLNNKNLKRAEDEDHEMDEELIYKLNKLKKIENEVLGYEVENDKLRKMITQLQKEQEKYGIEASQAHAKYYQTIEEVKIKNNQITELQKKNAEVEAKLKHQQNLYEAVRSDRNLYSKNLLESQEEIQELMKKYTRMTHEVDEYKEEIKAKDAQLVKEDLEFNKIVEENKKTILEKKRVKEAITSTEEVIKNQEQHISRLKYIIQEARNEKQREEKDLEMVINERDILGTQLIKRNQELNILYEKIKLSQSNLAKGEIFYREKEQELETLKKDLTQLVNELKGTQQQIACIDDLKNEINCLDKDILAEKTKVKALEDELENPLNVHRWRKLEATDQENFERILKIQTLQRRLIAKTEEVEEKDNLIKEKEKLFMELKNILARQPGAEIHQQLQSYKESLKEKEGQMKKMLAELKNSQDEVDLLKFENERLRDEIGKMKNEYFRKRRDEDRAKDASEGNENGYQNYAQNYASGPGMGFMQENGQRGEGLSLGGAGIAQNS